MILKRGSVAAQVVQGSAPRLEARLGAAGGLAGLGVNIVTLAPGQRSSERHWHAASDEVLFVLEGCATVIENDGPHALGPGDAACWPAGVPNAHCVENRSDAPVVFLVAGTRPETDRVRYPDSNSTLFHEPPLWRVVADDGRVLRHGTVAPTPGG